MANAVTAVTAGQTVSAPIAIERLSKTLGGTLVLDRVDIALAAGEFFALLGPSGSGKTTLINLIAGFERPDTGDIRIDGKSILALPPHRRGIGVVFQSYALFPHLTVAENLAYPLRRKGLRAREIGLEVARSLELVRLGAYADRWIDQLSGGQQQRIAIARALISRPSVLLMDEPMAALDKSLREDIQIEIKALQRSLGATVLYITHDQREAMALADRVAILNRGRIEQADTPQLLFGKPQTSFVAQFITGASIVRGTAAAAPDGRWWLTTAGGLRLPGTWRGTASAGAAELAIAPADIRVAAEGLAAAMVETVTFGGESTTLHLTMADGSRLIAREFGPPRLREGEQVRVAWDPQAATIFPAQSTGG